MKCKADKENIIADALSRAQSEQTAEGIPEGNLKVQIHVLFENYPIGNDKMTKIRTKTSKDVAVTQASRYIINGWPNFLP